VFSDDMADRWLVKKFEIRVDVRQILVDVAGWSFGSGWAFGYMDGVVRFRFSG
jgi:hypothetical protein